MKRTVPLPTCTIRETDLVTRGRAVERPTKTKVKSVVEEVLQKDPNRKRPVGVGDSYVEGR